MFLIVASCSCIVIWTMPQNQDFHGQETAMGGKHKQTIVRKTNQVLINWAALAEVKNMTVELLFAISSFPSVLRSKADVDILLFMLNSWLISAKLFEIIWYYCNKSDPFSLCQCLWIIPCWVGLKFSPFSQRAWQETRPVLMFPAAALRNTTWDFALRIIFSRI